MSETSFSSTPILSWARCTRSENSWIWMVSVRVATLSSEGRKVYEIENKVVRSGAQLALFMICRLSLNT